MTLKLRQYIPPIGKSVKLKLWEDYSSRDIPIWAWLRIKAVNVESNDQTVTVEILNGNQPTGSVVTIPLSTVAAPIGWQARYTIHVKPNQVDAVLAWFARGIVVRQSHDMSGSMPTAFQPMDNSDQPHWQFCEVTDSVPAAECDQVFRVVKVEVEDAMDAYRVAADTCEYCHGTGRDSLARVNQLRASKGMPACDQDTIASLRQRNNWDETTQTFDCPCLVSSFRNLGRSKRAKVVKEWARDGWSTEYLPYAGGFWQRTRETVVKDWQV